MKNDKKIAGNSKIFQTIKSKIALMGIFSIFVAVSIGILGINSLNRNSSNSKIESVVNEIDVLQAKNLALEAQYQYYIDQDYLDRIIANLGQMTANAEMLRDLTDQKYGENVNKMLDGLAKIRANYGEISSYSSMRGFDGEDGLYGQYLEAGSMLSDSFSVLVDKQDWLEMKWVDAHMWTSGERTEVGGKEYVKLVYRGPVPERVKRDFLAFRVGGTLTYDKDCYITDVKLVNGTEYTEIDLAAADAVQGSG